LNINSGRTGICYLNRYGSGRKAIGNYMLSTLGEGMSKENKVKIIKNKVA
jgi:hypothetical protein